MASPPSSHPLLRPAVSVAQTANSSQPGIAYYRPLTAGSESEVTAQALASSPPPERSIGTASPVPFAGSGASGVGASAGATTGSSVNTPTSPTSTADIPNLTPSSRVASPPPLGRAGSLTRPPGGFRASAAEAGSVAAPETVSAPATNGTGHRKPSRWEEKVQSDLTGWRGGAENECVNIKLVVGARRSAS
jgi:hypothetical protein